MIGGPVCQFRPMRFRSRGSWPRWSNPTGRPRHRRVGPGPQDPHHQARPGIPTARRPGQTQLPRSRSQPSVGSRSYLRGHLVRLHLRRLRHRRLQPPHRRLAGVHLPVCRPRSRRPGNGDLDQAGPHLNGLVHHRDRGVQYLSIRYTERLAEAEAAPSVGSRGDSYDDALGESVNSLFRPCSHCA